MAVGGATGAAGVCVAGTAGAGACGGTGAATALAAGATVPVGSRSEGTMLPDDGTVMVVPSIAGKRVDWRPAGGGAAGATGVSGSPALEAGGGVSAAGVAVGSVGLGGAVAPGRLGTARQA